MATNEQRRQASGRNNATNRQAIGSGNAAERRAIQTNNTNERRGSSIQDDLNSLIRPEKQSAALRTVEPRGSAPSQRGSGTYTGSTAAPNTGTGVASPFSENEVSGFANRDYWPKQTLMTTDGLLVLSVRPVKTVRMKDANGGDVVMNYAQFAPEPDDEE